MHGIHALGEIDADEYDDHGPPLASELLRVRTSHRGTLWPEAATRPGRDGEVPFVRWASHQDLPVTTVRILDATDFAVLETVASDVFDDYPRPELSREFLCDPRHHLAVAINEQGVVVGMAGGVHYAHPDKEAQLFINEVGVSTAYVGQGLGKRLLAALLQRASE